MRAGTTWLTRILKSHPDCSMAPSKEMHFFDVRYGTFSRKQYYNGLARRLNITCQRAVKQVQKTLDRIDGDTTDRDRTDQDEEGLALHDASMGWSDRERSQFFARARLDKVLPKISDVIDTLSLRDVGSYVDYLKRKTFGAAAFGEITPSYSVLPAAAFAEMGEALPGAHFIFIMRDPVERLWSHVRYFAERSAKRYQKQLDVDILFDKALRKPGGKSTRRSNYHRTIEELESAISADRILYFFYETMTSPETGPAEIRRLEDALGLKPVDLAQQLFKRPVNASPPATLGRELEAAAIDVFRPVYDFVEQRFGRQPGWRFAPAAASHDFQNQS